jgi:predicted RNA-binding protein with PIN domain
VADDPAPERLDVVTSDAGLAARVRAQGANVLAARAFRNRLDLTVPG